MLALRVFTLALLALSCVFAQFEWKNHSSMSDMKDIRSFAGRIWSSTSGGILNYNPSDGSFITYTKSEGLISQNLAASCIASENELWAVSERGIINIYNKNSETFSSLLSLYDPSNINRSVSGISSSGDTVFVYGNFGVSLVNSKTKLFIDTYSAFSNIAANYNIFSVLKDSLIYIGTNSGIIRQKQGFVNLFDPNAWELIFPSTKMTGLAKFKSKIYASTGNTVFSFNYSSKTWTEVITVSEGITGITGITASDTLLYIIAGSRIYGYSGSSVNQVYSRTNTVFRDYLDAGNDVFYAASNHGLIKISKDTSYTFTPNMPAQNRYNDLSVDYGGNLWIATGNDVGGVGIMKFDGKNWKLINRDSNPEIKSDFYIDVHVAGNGKIYFGNWGNGLAELSSDGFRIFDVNNTPMIGVPDAPSYLVIPGIASDSEGNIWCISRQSAGANCLYEYNPVSNEWNSYGNSLTNSRAVYTGLISDLNDTKWTILLQDGLVGLHYFNENLGGGYWGYLNESRGLNSSIVNCVAVDNSGSIIVGTAAGINVLSTSIDYSKNRILVSVSLPTPAILNFGGQKINSIMIDPLDRKWIATDKGVSVLSSDLFSILYTFNSSNSPLPEDQVTNMAINRNDGTVYLATKSGISAVKTNAKQPSEDFSNIFVYPNPVITGEGVNQLHIDGLTKNSELNIFTVSGKLIRKIKVLNHPEAWDLKDEHGNLVPSGVYIIAGYDSLGKTGLSKVMVVAGK